MATSKHSATLEAREYQSGNSRLQTSLSEFEKKALESIQPFLASIALKPVPEKIFHYTDFSGLHNILESGLLRFGDVFTMNDPSEVHHGMAVSLHALSERVKATDSKIHRFFLERYERFLRSGLKRSGHFQVCCFSTLGDSLSQWRAYGDNGAGYALCFDAAMLERAYAQVGGTPAENRAAFHVTYDDEKLLVLQQSLISAMYDLIALPSAEMGAQAGSKFLQDLSTMTSVHALHTSLYFKHEAYKDEGEYRFLTVEPTGRPLQGLKRRIRPHELIRFTEFEWRELVKDSLQGIVIGPSAPLQAEVFVQECLEEYHHRKLKVTRSAIPYRIPLR